MERGKHRSRRSAGFTMVELLVAMTISAMVLAGVLSAFVFFTRSGLAMGDYQDMESQRRDLVAEFSRDVRRAESASWNGDDTLLLRIGSQSVIYRYLEQSEAFTRQVGSAGQTTLGSGIESFSFHAYDRDGNELPDLKTAAADCKMIRITFGQERKLTPGPDSHTRTSSARFVLRNKPVSAP